MTNPSAKPSGVSPTLDLYDAIDDLWHALADVAPALRAVIFATIAEEMDTGGSPMTAYDRIQELFEPN